MAEEGCSKLHLNFSKPSIELRVKPGLRDFPLSHQVLIKNFFGIRYTHPMTSAKKSSGTEQPKKPTAQEKESLSHEVRRTRFIKELLGIFLGISLAMMLSAVVPAIRENYSLGVVILWGGALGGLLSSFERFERAGAALTRGENKVLNYMIGIIIPLLALVALLYFLR